MKQPIKKRGTSITKNKKTRTVSKTRTVRKTVRIGTSKLEEDFARDFLDKLGVKYIYQFEAKDIGRFYDFAVILNDEMTTGSILLIEIDGGVSTQNAHELFAAGADVLVAGTAVFGAPDPEEAIRQMKV